MATKRRKKMLDSRKIEDLREDVAAACREVIKRAKQRGIDIIITSTVRDDAYQAKLYAQGRTTKGAIVTQQKLPTFHWNQAGLAFDFCPVNIVGGKNICLWNDTAKFRAVGKIALEMGLEWGGDWKSFVDMPHIQWSDGGKFTAAMVRAGKFPPRYILRGETAPNGGKIAVGSKVQITGTNYATGEKIPPWALKNVYTILQISGAKALLQPINSWVLVGDLKIC